MSDLRETKKKYEEIPIPEELHQRVEEAIRNSEEKRKAEQKIVRIRRKKKIVKTVAAVAGFVVVFTAVLNTNFVFAREVQKIPVIGNLARVLTFRSYEEEDENLQISVEIPSIETIEEDMTGMTDEINQEIYHWCEEYANEGVERAKQYREAFLSTGGTEQEWMEHNIKITVWYEVKASTEEYLSLAIKGNENWTSAYTEDKYYNLDLKQKKLLSLKDLLGENYIQIANESIQSQMSQRTEIEFWEPDQGGFTTVSDDTKFYINQNGNPVVVFGRYEIAPGSAGQIEFEITDGTEEKKEQEETQEATEETTQDITQETDTQYEDNFSVDSSAVADFANEIKNVVAAQDLSALADLASYPLYIGFSEGGISVNTKEELLELGAERIFTPELEEAVEATEESSLSPSMAGFSMTKDGRPNVVFGVTGGRLAIQGINY